MTKLFIGKKSTTNVNTINTFKTDLGSYEITLQNRTLLVTISGILELELALRLMLQAKIIIDELPHDHWASLVDLRQWGLHPPEIVTFVQEFQEWASQQGQLAEAAVVADSVLKVMARDKLIEDTRPNVHQEYFTTMEDAREWLEALDLF